MPPKLIDCARIAEMTSLKKRYVEERLTRRQDFPATYYLGSVRRWDEEEVEAYIESKRAAPDGRTSAYKNR